MTSNVTSSIVKIEKESLIKLVEEVKETLAINFNTNTSVSKNKSYGIVDLWNHRRSARTASSLRKFNIF